MNVLRIKNAPSTLQILNNKQLLDLYAQAMDLNLERDFFALLEAEIAARQLMLLEERTG